MNDPRQTQINEALTMFIAGDLISLSVVESQNFKNLLEKLNPKYQVPSRKTLTNKLIHEKCSEMRNNIKHKLKAAQNICLTLDLWSSRQMRAFLGVTGHYIADWQMRSVMLACTRFKGRHTGDAIRREYEETVTCYEIGHKVSNIVTDNASNMIKAFSFSLPGFDKPTTDSMDTEVDHDNYDYLTDSNDDGCEVSGDFESLPKHSSCFAHSLQLVVRDGLEDCTGQIKQLISKASKIVNYVRKSVHASEILSDEKRLQAANMTRWNSQFYMLKSILAVDEEKLNQLDCIKLTSYERKVLQELCLILKPFEEVTLEVQKESSVSASLAIPLTIALKSHMHSISGTFNSKMLKSLKISIEKRLSKYENNEDFITATVLDPRFKLTWCINEAIRDEHCANIRAKMNVFDEPEELNSPPEKKAKVSTSSIFNFIPQTPKRQRHTSVKQSELDLYLTADCESSDSNPLQYWSAHEEKFPTLAKMACTYLALPASSAPVERLFSIAGKVFRPERCSLTDSNFEALMFLKCNKEL